MKMEDIIKKKKEEGSPPKIAGALEKNGLEEQKDFICRIAKMPTAAGKSEDEKKKLLNEIEVSGTSINTIQEHTQSEIENVEKAVGVPYAQRKQYEKKKEEIFFRPIPAKQTGTWQKGEEEEQERFDVEFLPVRVSKFDELISSHGIERGNSIILAGGCGSGKTTFCFQSLYNGALHGEKGVYITFEEPPDKLKRHMKHNFGWDVSEFEEKGLIAVIRKEPFDLAMAVEAAIIKQRGKLLIDLEDIELPFRPDRVVLDSLTALSSAFEENLEHYRAYIRFLFQRLNEYNSVNIAVAETEQD
ncbi:MAG: ATPase domain-containing protein, partial [Candidatus Micrarchaeia archaeon]